MISKKIAIDVLNEALSTGADYAEIFYEKSSAQVITVEKEKVETSTTVEIHGVGLRILKENKSIYGFTADIKRSGLLKLASNLKMSFNGKRVITVTNLKFLKKKENSPIAKSYDLVSREEKIKLIKEGTAEIAKLKDPRIVRYMGMFSNNHKRIAIYNSKGIWLKKDNEFGRLIYQIVAADENGYESSFEGPGCQKDISFFKNEVNPKELAKKAVNVALKNLTAKECPSGKMPVVIGNGWGGVLFHEACGHALEASSVSKNLSCFSNKLGEKVASPIVTAIDDSTIPYAWGSLDIDDEGNFGEKRILIKNGILKNYLVDDFNGRRMNMKGNGACRRQNYRFSPTSRMSNTYIDNGKSTPEEIISSTKKGLYTVGFTGGSVDPVTGEFNFSCSEAYIIRDGKICEPVKGATLIGKGYEILKKIDMVGNDLAFGQGICGASSGSIRTCVGQPTIRISEILVGGRGGELK